MMKFIDNKVECIGFLKSKVANISSEQNYLEIKA